MYDVEKRSTVLENAAGFARRDDAMDTEQQFNDRISTTSNWYNSTTRGTHCACSGKHVEKSCSNLSGDVLNN